MNDKITKKGVFLAILPVSLNRKWESGVSTVEVAQSAMEQTNEIMSYVNKMSKSTMRKR
jgi:hypothetical protein